MKRIKRIPAVFVHKGFPDYLKKTVACAREHHNRTIVLGDLENEKIQADEWYPMADYYSSCFEAFKKTYKHRSKNPEWFELICFERYFVLLEYMKQKRLEECFMIDSDVLLYGEVDSLPCSGFDAGGGTEKIFVNPCVLYWHVSALEDFVSFCLTQYQNQEQWRILEKRYLDIKKENPRAEINICDMFLLKFWIDSTAYKWKNFFDKDAFFVIDGNINNPQCTDTSDKTYEMAGWLPIKKYKFKDNLPFIVDNSHKKDQVFAVHCQGSAKKYIDLLYQRKSSPLAYILLTFRRP